MIDSRYRVIKSLGSGGMADVYLAHDEVLDRDVALKVLSQRYANDEEFVERFKREAQSAAALSHPNIVSIYDRGETDDGTYYIAMEYLPGGTLKERILRRGSLPPRTAAAVALQIAEALQVAHKHGVVHRDVKPHNILVTASGDVKVADFGIARAASSTTMTRTGSILGTAHYISPEQAMGEPVTPQSDLYSLGVVLYEMLTGQLPFDAETPIGIAMQHVNGHLRPPKEINPDIPEGINAVTVRLLAKDPAERYADTAELIDDLEQVSKGLLPAAATTQVLSSAAAPTQRAVNSRTQRTKLGAAPVRSPYAAGAAGRPGKEKRGGGIYPWIMALVFLAVLALLGIIGWSLWQNLQNQNATLAVPNLQGKTFNEAKLVVGNDFNLVVSRTEDSPQPEGTIISQDPAPNDRARKGSTISLVVSGRQLVDVPNVSGLSQNEAEQKLGAAGFKPDVQTRESSSQDAGKVISQSPPGGGKAPKGSQVTIVVGKGPATVQVPDLTGMSPSDAAKALSDAGLNLGNQSEAPSNTVAKGMIIAQNPSPGTSVAPNTAVSVTVSSGPQKVAVPNVQGQTVGEATQTLADAGLSVGGARTQQSSQPAGTVISTSPGQGSKVNPGTPVTLIVSSGPGKTTPGTTKKQGGD